MKKKFRMTLAILLVALLGLVIWQIISPGEPEPVYQGRPLSFWLANAAEPVIDIENPKPTLHQAMRAMGTNSVPALLRMLRANDPAWKLKLIALGQKQNLIKIEHVPASELNYRAALGFEQLGTDASNTVPTLIKLYQQTSSEDSRRYIAQSLGAIGPSAKTAVSELVKDIYTTNAALFCLVIYALGEIHSEPTLALPPLINCLSDPQPVRRAQAASALGQFGAEAKPAVPALIQLLQDPNSSVNNAARDALKTIDVKPKKRPELHNQSVVLRSPRFTAEDFFSSLPLRNSFL